MATPHQSNFEEIDAKPEGYLAGKFLIAGPAMQDRRFRKTVIYMCAHDAEQAMGIIINKPKSDLRLSSMLPHLDVYGDVTKKDTKVLYGGPVEAERGFVLHSRDFYDKNNSLPLSDSLAMTTNKSVLNALTRPEAPDRAVLALGYTGWHAGQLEAEINRNSWMIGPANEDLIFAGNAKAKWAKALGLLGISPALLSAQAGEA